MGNKKKCLEIILRKKKNSQNFSKYAKFLRITMLLNLNILLDQVDRGLGHGKHMVFNRVLSTP